LNDEEIYHEYEELEDEQQMRPDWMIMRLDANMEDSSELGLRDI